MAQRTRHRGAAVVTTALMLCAPLLSGCGPAATSRAYTPAAGVDADSRAVDVLNAVIVAAEDGSGNLVATVANGSTSQEVELVSVTSSGSPVAKVKTDGVTVEPAAAVNLADDGGLPATGDYELGQFVPLTFTFDTDDGVMSLDMQVVVVPDHGDYAGLGTVSSTPTSSGSPSASATPAGE